MNQAFREKHMSNLQPSEEACRSLKAKPVFAGQIDGDTVVNDEWANRILKLVEAEKPKIVFTHWP